jgi:lysozyme
MGLSKYFHKPTSSNKSMNRQNVYEQLKIDEGVKYEIYKDTKGLDTVGVGHLITSHDLEYGRPVGTTITENRASELFEEDLDIHIEECEVLYNEFHSYPGEVQEILVNMCFNMGRPNLAKFKGMRRGLDARDWNAAADEMVDSKWYRELDDLGSERAKRLVTRMRNV